MPLAALRRSAGASLGSHRGPPDDAAVICAATPMPMVRSSSIAGPDVERSQSGFEQWCPTLVASVLTVFALNSSRTGSHNWNGGQFYMAQRAPVTGLGQDCGL